jgi:hypothetical protein
MGSRWKLTTELDWKGKSESASQGRGSVTNLFLFVICTFSTASTPPKSVFSSLGKADDRREIIGEGIEARGEPKASYTSFERFSIDRQTNHARTIHSSSLRFIPLKVG